MFGIVCVLNEIIAFSLDLQKNNGWQPLGEPVKVIEYSEVNMCE